MYALVEYKGKQYKAEKGAMIQVDKLDVEKISPEKVIFSGLILSIFINFAN